MINCIEIFVITLKDETKRKKHIIKELNKLNLKFNIFYATKGNELSRKDLALYSKKQTFKAIKRDMSLDEISCALSHAKIYRKICKKKYKFTLILEDDVILTIDLINILKKINNFPLDWELINFTSDAKKIAFGKPIFKKYRFAKFQEKPNRTSAYLIKYQTARILCQEAFPIRHPADGLTGRHNLPDLKSYGISRRVVKLKNFSSTIKYRNTFFEKYKILSWILKSNFMPFLMFFINVLKKKSSTHIKKFNK